MHHSPSMPTSPEESNAYVGPVPVPKDRAIYGRDREITMALNRLLFERLLLIYSPSGAGKTSVIAAKNGIRARAQEEGIRAAPIIRVSLGAATAVAAGVNRYLFSALRCLHPQAEDSQLIARLQPPLAGNFFCEELQKVQASNQQTEPLLLIFDQFEELLTLDPTDEPQKREFLTQVGVALKPRDRLALFAMREDFIAGLDPFLPLLPSRLSAMLRLDFLSFENAKAAVVGPPEEFSRVLAAAGTEPIPVHFANEACDELLTQLSMIRVLDPVKGVLMWKQGLHIEPLHLQIVCTQLWNRRKSPTQITLTDLRDLKDEQAIELQGVDAAMASYYRGEVARIAKQFAETITERDLRNWFERVLISHDGRRLFTLQGMETESNLTAAVLQELDRRYLIRAEQRHEMTYYELAHDRFVEPVRKSNAAWRKTLSAFQQAAENWQASNRKDDLLVTGDVLTEGEAAAAATQASEISATDQLFLAACQRLRAQKLEREDHAAKQLALETQSRKAAEEREQAVRQRGRLLGFVVACSGALVGLAVVTFSLFSQNSRMTKDIERFEGLATGEELVRQGLATLDDSPAMSIEKAQQAIPIFRKFNVDAKSGDSLPADLKLGLLPVAWANKTMRILGDSSSDSSQELRHISSIEEILIADQKSQQFIITRGFDGLVLCWLNDELRLKEPVARVHTVAKMGITADAQYLIAGHYNGQVCRWTLGLEPTYETAQSPTGRLVTALDVSRSAKSPGLTAVVNDGMAMMCDMTPTEPKLLETWKSEEAAIERVFVSPDGKSILYTIPSTLLDMKQQADLESVNQLRLRENQLNVPEPLLTMPRISRTAFAPDGSLLAFGCENSTAVDLCLVTMQPQIKVVPRLANLRQQGRALPQDTFKQYRITALAVSPKVGTPPANWIAGVQEMNISERNQKIPNQANIDLTTEANFFVLRVQDETAVIQKRPRLPKGESWFINVLAFSSDGRYLAAGLQNGMVCIWSESELRAGAEPGHVLQLGGSPGIGTLGIGSPKAAVTALSFLSKGKGSLEEPWLFVGHADGAVRRWDLKAQQSISAAKKEITAQFKISY